MKSKIMTRIDLIEKHLWAFGFLPLLLVMEIFENEEEYECCNDILKVLNRHSKKYGCYIPKKYSQEAIIQMKINFMSDFGLSGDIAYNNNAWYAAEILYKIQVLHNPLSELSDFDKALKKCLQHSI